MTLTRRIPSLATTTRGNDAPTAGAEEGGFTFELPKFNLPKVEEPETPKMSPAPEPPAAPPAVPEPEAPASNPISSIEITPVPSVESSSPAPPTPAAPEAPAFEPPEMPSMPEMPEMPSMPEMPKLEVPKFQMPKFQAPKFDLPKVVMPEMPAMPEMPEMPSMPEMPEMPKVELPEAPVAPPPSPVTPEPPAAADLPSASTSTTIEVTPPPAPVDVPSTTAAEKYLEMTQGGSDAAPSDGPSFELPSFEAPELPSFEVPELPSFEMPDVSTSIETIKTEGLQWVESSVQGIQTSVGAWLDSLRLPKEVTDVVDVAASQDPEVYKTTAQFGVPLLVFFYWRSAYGGFAGVADPNRVYAELQDKNANAVLIDVRSDREREEDGIPDLKFVARDKVAAVPFQRLAQGTVRQVASGATKLQVDLTSLIISSLSMINPRSTKIYLMAGNRARTNGAAKDLARKLRTKGCRRPFIIGGGFQQWQKEGLPVALNKDKYERGTVKVVSDKAVLLARDAGDVLSDPLNAAGAVAAASATAAAIANWQYLLEFIGVGGLLFSFALYASEFSSINALLVDIEDNIESVMNQSKEVANKVDNLKKKL